MSAEVPMPEPETTTVELNGFSCRVWKKGSGPKLGFLAGFGGLPRWIPFLDALAKERTVIVPSLPGFPGGERGHTVLDSHLDWVLATQQLLHKAGLDGADLAGSSVGGSLAAEVAAIWPQSGAAAGADRAVRPVRREGPGDRSLGAARPRRAGAAVRRPGALGGAEGRARGANSPEWPIEQVRAAEAAARIFWPLGNTKLEKRLPLIEAPTLLLWGEQDRIMPRSYADKFAARDRGQDRDPGHPRRRPSRRTRQARRGRRRDPRMDALTRTGGLR